MNRRQVSGVAICLKTSNRLAEGRGTKCYDAAASDFGRTISTEKILKAHTGQVANEANSTNPVFL